MNSDVEAVEKPQFRRQGGKKNGAELFAPFSFSSCADACPALYLADYPALVVLLLPISVVRELLDVVHHAVELPLRIDLPPPA